MTLPAQKGGEKACANCGYAVRKGSAFCYHCGKALTGIAPTPVHKPPTGSLGTGRPADAITEVGATDPQRVFLPSGNGYEGEVPEEPESRSVELSDGAKKTERTRFPGASKPKAPAVTRSLTPKTAEWVEPSGSSWRFIIVAIGLAVLAALFVIFAVYMH